MGDCVRIKLSTSERGKLGDKNMAPVFSDVYIVKEVLGGAGGWTYLLTPANGVLKDKMRHFNNLRKAETGKAEEEWMSKPSLGLNRTGRRLVNGKRVTPRNRGISY